jgi:hypothetical protein
VNWIMSTTNNVVQGHRTSATGRRRGLIGLLAVAVALTGSFSLAAQSASARPFNSLTLSAKSTQIVSGGSARITATASSIPPNSYIALFDDTATNQSPVVNFCFAVMTCSVTDSHAPAAGTGETHTYLARIVTNTSEGPVVVSTSAPLAVTWGMDTTP